MASPTKPNEFFPAIGEVVDQADKTKDAQEGGQGDEDEKVVDEIESLCMKCYEQVRREGFRQYTMKLNGSRVSREKLACS